MDRISKIAERLIRAKRDEFEGIKADDITQAVARFIKDNPNPKDEDFHKWAEGEGYEVDEAEAAAYKLVTLLSSFLFKGRANEKGISKQDVDKDELKMGIGVEKEHADDEGIRERIALDHLAEAPADAPLKYYTALKLMERMIEALVKMDKGKAEGKIKELNDFVDGLGE